MSLDLVSVLEDLGVTVTREDEKRVHGLCPGHEEFKGRPDSKPSWSMDKELLVHHCWSCPCAGTLRQLIADMGGESADASEWLADYTKRRAIRRLRERPKAPEAKKQSPARLSALERRFRAFEDPPDWALEARGLERFAVVHYDLRWDPAVDHWIIPISDEYGKLAGFQRKAPDHVLNRPKGLEKKFMVFGLHQLTGKWGILVESPLDVVRMYSEGVEGGVAAYGAFVSNAQLDLINERCDDVVLALDNDETGNEQRNRIWHSQWRRGNRYRVLDYTGIDGKDPGEMTSAEIRRHKIYSPLWRPPEPKPRPRAKPVPGQRFLEWREARRLEAQRQP